MKLLLVEDEIPLADALSEILKRNKYSVDAVYDGEDGLEYAKTGLYDCIVLDIMLPRMDGIQVLRKLRTAGFSTPVMLLTAKSEVEDIISGLDCGADDYLTKPFSTGELLARIRALTRRTGDVIPDCYQFHDLKLNMRSYALSTDSNSIKLSLKEYQIMEMLIANPRQIIPKERIIEKSGALKRMWNTTTLKSIFPSCERSCLPFLLRCRLKQPAALAILWRHRNDSAPAAV